MIIGAVVGFILGYLVQEKVTGKNYGAGQWQRPKDKQFVGDVEAFFRWLAFPILTAAIGAVLSAPIEAMLVTFILSASALALVVAAVGLFVGLYIFFLKYELGR